MHPRATLTRDYTRLRRGRWAPRPPDRGFITWTTLTLLTVGSVGNLGSAPALSVLGLASVFLYVLPAVVFLLPVTLVAAELASGWSGGVYHWERIEDARAFYTGPWLDGIVQRYGMQPQIEFYEVFAVTDNASGKVELFEETVAGKIVHQMA